KSDQRDVEGAGGVDREGRRTRNGAHDRDARDRRLLQDLERGSSGHQQDRLAGRQTVEGGPPDDLVDGVVPADVLAADQQLPFDVEQPRGMQRAGAAEALLVAEETLRERLQDLAADAEA